MLPFSWRGAEEGRNNVMGTPASLSAGELPEAAIRRQSQIRGLIGACAGNLVEWFDFFVYAYTKSL